MGCYLGTKGTNKKGGKMRYLIIPIAKLILVLSVLLLIVPSQWLKDLLWDGKLKGFKDAFTLDDEYLLEDLGSWSGFKAFCSWIFCESANKSKR